MGRPKLRPPSSADQLEDLRVAARFLAERVPEVAIRPGAWEILRQAVVAADHLIDALVDEVDEDGPPGVSRRERVEANIIRLVDQGARRSATLVQDAEELHFAIRFCEKAFAVRNGVGRPDPERTAVPFRDDPSRPLEYRASHLAAEARELLADVLQRVRSIPTRGDLVDAMARLRGEVAAVEAYAVIARNPVQSTERRKAAIASAVGSLKRAFVEARQAEAVHGNSDSLFTDGDAMDRAVDRKKAGVSTEKLERLVRQGATLIPIEERFGVSKGRDLLDAHGLSKLFDDVQHGLNVTPDVVGGAAPVPSQAKRIHGEWKAVKARREERDQRRRSTR